MHHRAEMGKGNKENIKTAFNSFMTGAVII